MREVERTLDLIRAMPGIGRRSAGPGTREFPVRRLPILIVYRTAGDTVDVLTVSHTSRDPRTKWAAQRGIDLHARSIAPSLAR